MVLRLLAIGFIYACTAIAWAVLGASIHARTGSTDHLLRGRVSSTWGTTQIQHAPGAHTERLEARLVEAGEESTNARSDAPPRALKTETVRIPVPLPLEQTRAAVSFDLDHRQKGLLWYSTYTVNFDGSFRFRNTTPSDSVWLGFPLPAARALYDDLRVTLDGTPVGYQTRDQSLVIAARVPPGGAVTLGVAYRSQGLDQWRYVLGKEVAEVRDFELVMDTDFDAIDFPENTLSPGEKEQTAAGWRLRWRYANLLSGFEIGMDMPERLQPGPLAGRISLFAPISLLFFFTVIFILATLRRIELHPMNYAFLAAAFFAFHLLLAYLVDHLSIHLAFLISAVVSITLVVSYLRLVVGRAFAFREAALAQLIYLVLFSYAFFFKGFTGLAITIGSILTLFASMQLTGRIRWSGLFAAESRDPAPRASPHDQGPAPMPGSATIP